MCVVVYVVSRDHLTHLLHRVVAVAVRRPHRLQRAAVALGAQHTCRGDGVLAVAAQQHEASVVVVGERLREELAATQLRVKERQTIESWICPCSEDRGLPPARPSRSGSRSP